MASSGQKLYACATQLPSSGSGVFTEIYDLGSGAVEPVSITTLNDRAVIACGSLQKPLVFLGGLDPSGADWAVPKAALVSYDSGITAHDIGPQVLDPDSGTSFGMGNFPVNSGMLYICTDVSGVSGFSFDVNGNSKSGVINVETYMADWSGWSVTDGTASGNKTFFQSGCVTASSLQVAAYHTLFEVPGFWHRVSFPSGTSGGTLRRILFQAPCQELQVIGDGQPVAPTRFIQYDASAANAKDWTPQVTDYVHVSYARLNDGATPAVGMASGDYIYIGALDKFDQIEILPGNDNFNTSGASGIWQYWTGTAWSGLTVTDGTAVSGATFAQKGRITFSAPADWRETRAINYQFERLYWLRMTPSANLLNTTYIAECYVWPVPEAMVNYKFASTLRSRVVLGDRPDQRAQIGITRDYEEYGMTGADSTSQVVGGQDEIVSMTELFNNLFIAKPDCFYILNGYSSPTLSVERAETGGQAPINNTCVVPAAVTEADSKSKMGVYFLNTAGAWCFTGIQTYQLSKDVNWWDPAADNPRLDLNYLWKAAGVYWPERNWIVWAVPLITGESASQTTNNALIIYDLTLQAFIPPRMYAAASLTTAYHYAADAPGHRGELGLYAGNYSGGISRLFGPSASGVSGWGMMGWMAFGAPEIVKELRHITAYGKGTVTITLYLDGNDTTAAKSWTMTDLASIGTNVFAVDQKGPSYKARFFKFKIDVGADGDFYGLGLQFAKERNWDFK